jgi:hypothetical protein
VHGPQSANYDFTSALPVQLLVTLAPSLMPMIEKTDTVMVPGVHVTRPGLAAPAGPADAVATDTEHAAGDATVEEADEAMPAEPAAEAPKPVAAPVVAKPVAKPVVKPVVKPAPEAAKPAVKPAAKPAAEAAPKAPAKPAHPKAAPADGAPAKTPAAPRKPAAADTPPKTPRPKPAAVEEVLQ